MNRYFDKSIGRDAVKLLPGEYTVSATDAIVTVLGSCVAACIRDERRNVGGMNHFMLPLSGNGDERSEVRSFNRASFYGINAMELLINELVKLGSRRQDLTAKVFGGGAIVGNMKTLDIGRANGEFVLSYLKREGIRLLAHDLYGALPRKVHFLPESGAVRVHYLRTLKNDTLVRRERDYAATIDRQMQPNMEMFTWPTKSVS